MLAEITSGDLTEVTHRTYVIQPFLALLNEFVKTNPPVFVYFVDKLRELHPDKKNALGGYALARTRFGVPFGVILLDGNLQVDEVVLTLIHEYAHHLSQQNHDFTMFELWKDYLEREYYRRWNDVERETDQGDAGCGPFVVGEICFGKSR